MHSRFWKVLTNSVPPFAFATETAPSPAMHRCIQEIRFAREQMQGYFAGNPEMQPFHRINTSDRARAWSEMVEGLPGSLLRPIPVGTPEYEPRSPEYPESDSAAEQARAGSSMSVAGSF